MLWCIKVFKNITIDLMLVNLAIYFIFDLFLQKHVFHRHCSNINKIVIGEYSYALIMLVLSKKHPC